MSELGDDEDDVGGDDEYIGGEEEGEEEEDEDDMEFHTPAANVPAPGWDVVAIVKRKIVFSKRPMPITGSAVTGGHMGRCGEL